jgi:hypothetical protein
VGPTTSLKTSLGVGRAGISDRLRALIYAKYSQRRVCAGTLSQLPDADHAEGNLNPLELEEQGYPGPAGPHIRPGSVQPTREEGQLMQDTPQQLEEVLRSFKLTWQD